MRCIASPLKKNEWFTLVFFGVVVLMIFLKSFVDKRHDSIVYGLSSPEEIKCKKFSMHLEEQLDIYDLKIEDIFPLKELYTFENTDIEEYKYLFSPYLTFLTILLAPVAAIYSEKYIKNNRVFAMLVMLYALLSVFFSYARHLFLKKTKKFENREIYQLLTIIELEYKSATPPN